MIGKEAIEKIESLVEDGLITEVDGKTYSPKNLKPVYHDPRPEGIGLRTLSGFVEFLLSPQGLAWKEKNLVVVVQDHANVGCFSEPFGESNQRALVVAAALDRPVFPFGQWLSPEEFAIKTMALFEDSEDLETIQAYAGKLTVENEVTVEDDGTTQRATTRKGISGGLVETTSAPRRITLVPIRTFDEIDQPASEFVFRVRSRGEYGVECAIFEADAGAWKSDAANRIKSFLSGRLEGIPVIS